MDSIAPPEIPPGYYGVGSRPYLALILVAEKKNKLYYTLEWRHHQYDVISILALFWKDPVCIDLRFHQSWKSFQGSNCFKIHEFSRTTYVTNAKPSTLAWPLDDKNIQFPTVSSKYNSISDLGPSNFYPCWIWAQMMTSSAQFLGYNSWRKESI